MANWKKYLLAFYNRLGDFVKNPVIVIYFISIVLVVGSFGVWYNYFDFDGKSSFWGRKDNLSNLATYSISIIAATMADFLLAKKNNGRGIKIFSFSLFLLAFLASVIALVKINTVFGFIGLFLSYILWIIVYSNDETKSIDPISGNDANGGNNPETRPINGTTNSFTI